MSDTSNQNSESAQPKKSSKKFLIIIILVVLLAGVGGGGFYFWRASSTAAAASETSGKKSSKKAHAKNDEESPDEADAEKGDKTAASSLPDDEDVKAVVELPPFIVNLADSEQARYLRMSVTLGIDGGEEKSEKPDQLFITRVRNAMLSVLSEKKSEDVLNADGKAKLRKELLKAAQAASEEPHVQAIYITDFIVQL